MKLVTNAKIASPDKYAVIKTDMSGVRNKKFLAVRNGKDIISPDMFQFYKHDLYGKWKEFDLKDLESLERSYLRDGIYPTTYPGDLVGEHSKNRLYLIDYNKLSSHQNEVIASQATRNAIATKLEEAADPHSKIELGDFKFLFKYMVLVDQDHFYGLRYDFETDKVRLLPFNSETLRCHWTALQDDRCHLLNLEKESRRLGSHGIAGNLFSSLSLLK